MLRNLSESGALDHLVLIGSWVLPVYSKNFGISPIPFTTSDVDFSVIRPHDRSARSEPSIRQTLIDLGYRAVAEPLSGAEKFVPGVDAAGNSLSIDFLCEPGRIVRNPYPVPGLGIVSTPVRYQRVLLENTINAPFHGLLLTVPDPAYWAAHKIAISQLRTGEMSELKMLKDLDSAAPVIDLIGEKGIRSAAEAYPGKFLGLFRKGWDMFARRRTDLVT